MHRRENKAMIETVGMDKALALDHAEEESKDIGSNSTSTLSVNSPTSSITLPNKQSHKEIELARACGRGSRRFQSRSFHSPSSHPRAPNRSQNATRLQLAVPEQPPTTPKSSGRRQTRIKKLFPFSGSPLLRRPAPVMSSAIYSPQKSGSFPLQEVCCYHCGNIVNLIRAAKIMEHSSVEDLGRTVFDLEKLSDTGSAARCIYPLDSGSLHFFKAYNSFSTTVKTLTKSSRAHTNADSLLEPLQKTRITDKTPKRKSKKSSSRNDEICPLPSPVFCKTGNDQLQSWEVLDILDVEEMLKLLESTPEQKESQERDVSTSEKAPPQVPTM